MIKEFVIDCRARGLAEHTIEVYKSNIIAFLRVFNDPSKVSMDDLRSFLIDLRTRNLQGSTLKGYFSSISAYYDYLVFSGTAELNPVPIFRKRYLRVKLQYNGENTRQPGSIEQIKVLLSLASSEIFAKTIILFLVKTGIRRGELIAMDIQDIDLENGVFHVKPKPKRSNRMGFLDPELIAALREYLDWRKPLAKNEALWINTNGFRISRNYVYRIVTHYTGLSGMHDPNGTLNKKYSVHNFRHFFTTYLRKNGMPREFIQELRGDRRKSAVDIYDHIDTEELRRSYLECIPYFGVGPGRRTTLLEFA